MSKFSLCIFGTNASAVTSWVSVHPIIGGINFDHVVKVASAEIPHSKVINCREFPGGPVAKTPHSQCRGPGFAPWSGN